MSKIFKFIQVIQAEIIKQSHVSLAVSNERPDQLIVGVERGANGITLPLNKVEAIQLRERLVEAIHQMS